MPWRTFGAAIRSASRRFFAAVIAKRSRTIAKAAAALVGVAVGCGTLYYTFRRDRLDETAQISRERQDYRDALEQQLARATKTGNTDEARSLALQIEQLDRAVIANEGLKQQMPSVLTESAIAPEQQERLQQQLADAKRLPIPGVEDLLAQGTASFQLGDHAVALSIFDEVIKLSPSARAFNNRGLALRALSRHQEAIDSYNHAIAIDTGMPEIYLNLGVAHRAAGSPAQAIDAYEKALALRPEYVEAHVNLANVLNDTGRYDDALVECNRALNTRPGFVPGLIAKGVAQLRSGRSNDAVDTLSEAIANDPTRREIVAIRGARALALINLARFQDAVDEARKALLVDPSDIDSSVSLAIALARTSRREEALMTIAAIEPIAEKGETRKYAEVLKTKAGIYAEMEDLQRAEEEYRKALRLAPMDSNAHANLGSVLRDNRKAAEALAELVRALELDPRNHFAMYCRSAVLAEEGRLDDALVWLTKAIERSRKWASQAASDPAFRVLLNDPVLGPRSRALVAAPSGSSGSSAPAGN